MDVINGIPEAVIHQASSMENKWENGALAGRLKRPFGPHVAAADQPALQFHPKKEGSTKRSVHIPRDSGRKEGPKRRRNLCGGKEGIAPGPGI